MKSEYLAFIIGLLILCFIPVMFRWLRFLLKIAAIYVWNLLKKGVIRFFKIIYASIKAPFTKNQINWRRVFGMKVKKFNLENVTKNERGEKIDPSKAGYAFEKFVRDMYIVYGFQTYQGRAAKSVPGLYPPELLKTNGDGGVDVIAFGATEILIIQTKLQSSSIKGEHIAKTAAVRDIFAKYYKTFDKRAVKAVVITNSHIDNTARMFCKSHDVFVYEKESLEHLIAQANKRPA